MKTVPPDAVRLFAPPPAPLFVAVVVCVFLSADFDFEFTVSFVWDGAVGTVLSACID